jgi:hypothetical protein
LAASTLPEAQSEPVEIRPESQNLKTKLHPKTQTPQNEAPTGGNGAPQNKASDASHQISDVTTQSPDATKHPLDATRSSSDATQNVTGTIADVLEGEPVQSPANTQPPQNKASTGPVPVRLTKAPDVHGTVQSGVKPPPGASRVLLVNPSIMIR